MCFVVIVEDAENFEPRDVKPVTRDQWDGEDQEEDTTNVWICLCVSSVVHFILQCNLVISNFK